MTHRFGWDPIARVFRCVTCRQVEPEGLSLAMQPTVQRPDLTEWSPHQHPARQARLVCPMTAQVHLQTDPTRSTVDGIR